MLNELEADLPKVDRRKVYSMNSIRNNYNKTIPVSRCSKYK